MKKQCDAEGEDRPVCGPSMIRGFYPSDARSFMEPLSEGEPRAAHLDLCRRVPQLPRLSHFSTFLDLGRSNGLIAVTGAQDLAQLRAIYGHERSDVWVGMIGTKIITQINARGGAEASQLIGDQEIKRAEGSETIVGGRASTTTMTRRDIGRVVTAAEIATALNQSAMAFGCWCSARDADAPELTVPYVTLPERRPGHVPTAWVSEASPAEPAPQKSPQLRVVRPLPKAAALSVPL